MNVPFLAIEEIEAKAEKVLTDFYRKPISRIKPPIDVDTIVEFGMNLKLHFADLSDMFGILDAIGAVCLAKGQVWVDSGQVPEYSDNPEGRYRFTLGHEGGHWVLHRDVFSKVQSLLSKDTAKPHVCVLDPSNSRMEWQADSFSASLLMPAALVHSAWRDLHTVTDWNLNLLASHFKVSRQALLIRLKNLGLLLPERLPRIRMG